MTKLSATDIANLETLQAEEEVAVDNFASLYNACRDGNAMTRCAALRVTAQNWTSTRKDFMDQAERYGINSHTAATQWQAGRKA